MVTHVEVEEDLLPLLGCKEKVLDGIAGFVEYYDFSRANSSYEARVHAISKIASICYQSPKALNSVSLFNRLQAESGGLPSSSYEFCPVLITKQQFADVDLPHCWKFGEQVGDYLLSNLRALLEDVGEEDSLKYLNTSDEEIQIIRDNFKVFLFNVDLPSRSQMVRHRVSWQELSRRYVSGKKKEFDFYISEKMASVKTGLLDAAEYDEYSTNMLITACVNHYDAAIASGVKPEEARRILPQAMMTQIWGAFQPSQLDNWFQLRLDAHAQREIQQTTQAMHALIHTENE